MEMAAETAPPVRLLGMAAVHACRKSDRIAANMAAAVRRRPNSLACAILRMHCAWQILAGRQPLSTKAMGDLKNGSGGYYNGEPGGGRLRGAPVPRPQRHRLRDLGCPGDEPEPAQPVHAPCLPACHARQCQCRAEDGLDAAVSDVVARRPVAGRLRDVSEEPLVRRIRVRLGLGRCVSPARSALLPEGAGSGAIHSGSRRPAAGARCPRAALVAASVAGRLQAIRGVVVPPAVSERRGRRRLLGRRDAGAPRRAVSFQQSRLRRFRRVSSQFIAGKTQENPAGAPQGGRCRHWLSLGPRRRHHIRRLGVFSTVVTNGLTSSMAMRRT